MQSDYSFKTEIRELDLAGHKIKIKTVVNPESLFDQLLAKGSNHPDVKAENMPYWAELWPSSIALGKFLLENVELVKGKRVLEIGCGLGLSGICAHAAGADVIISDYLEEALNLAGESWSLNFESEAPVMQLNWMNPPDNMEFDVILAADVLYEKKNHPYLLEFFLKMTMPGGIVLLADPSRSATPFFFGGNFEDVFEKQKQVISIDNKNEITEIEIYVCRKIK